MTIVLGFPAERNAPTRLRRIGALSSALNSALLMSALVAVSPACKQAPVDASSDGLLNNQGRWRFDTMTHDAGPWTLTALWPRAHGVLVAVGWYGTIVSNAESETTWRRLASPTNEHLTGIVGFGNGSRFGLADADGEMVAVGWHGTILHYHPNPDGNPATDDGVWRAIAAPDAAHRLTAVVKMDPSCPDRDGDGVADDGDGSGWAGNAPCAGGDVNDCDDNCRRAANAQQRPLLDNDRDGCLGPGDAAAAVSSAWQADADSDGVGDSCDDDSASSPPPDRPDKRAFVASLFGVWAQADGDDISVVAVGEHGAVVTYHGLSAAASSSGAAAILDAANWVAQTSVAFRYDSDCSASTPRGATCSGSDHLPVSCSAQCNPVATTCNCPAGQGQCCDAAASTGAGCSDGTCSAVPNVCDAAAGTCSTLCPTCFRFADVTLRAVTGSVDGTVTAVGARGTVLTTTVNELEAVWRAPVCAGLDDAFADAPALAGVDAAGTAVTFVGSNGTVVRTPSSDVCDATVSDGVPLGFVSGIDAVGSARVYVVGDAGLLLRVTGADPVNAFAISTGIEHNLNAIRVLTDSNGGELLWMVGASGTIVRAHFE